MPDLSSRRTPLAIAAAVGAIVVVVGGFLVLRGSGELPTSASCDNVEPGGTKLRSAAPAPASPPPDAGSSAGQPPVAGEPAFRPATAEAVYCEDLADPFVLAQIGPVKRRLFVYGTNIPGDNVPVLYSTTVLRSERIEEALPALPAWSEPGAVWAPSVLAPDDRPLVLYYVTTDRASGRQCISSAIGHDPKGPFEDTSTAPFVCPIDLGGAIDPSVFVDGSGAPHLLWKSDGNCCGLPTRLFTQPLSADGRQLTGPPVELLTADQPWEGGVVEAPAMVEAGGATFLFYSGNAWNSAAYAIGYATCAGPEGPCTKPVDGPWLGSSDTVAGPGSAELFVDGDDRLRMVFSAWTDGKVGYDAGGFRSLFTVGVDVVDGQPVTAE